MEVALRQDFEQLVAEQGFVVALEALKIVAGASAALVASSTCPTSRGHYRELAAAARLIRNEIN